MAKMYTPVSADVREMYTAIQGHFLSDDPIVFCFRWTLLSVETKSYTTVTPASAPLPNCEQVIHTIEAVPHTGITLTLARTDYTLMAARPLHSSTHGTLSDRHVSVSAWVSTQQPPDARVNTYFQCAAAYPHRQ